MGIAIKREKFAMLQMIAEGLEELFKARSAFIQAPVMDIFFRGIDVNCDTENFAAKAICLNFHTGAVKGGVKVDDTHFKFSLLGAVSEKRNK